MVPVYIVSHAAEYDGHTLVGAYTAEAEALAAAQEAADAHWPWRSVVVGTWEGAECISERQVQASTEVRSMGLTTVPAYRRAVGWLTPEDMPPVIGSPGWATEASYGRDDGSGRRYRYADRQHTRSLRRQWRVFRRQYCR